MDFKNKPTKVQNENFWFNGTKFHWIKGFRAKKARVNNKNSCFELKSLSIP